MCLLVSEAKPNPVGYQNKDVGKYLSSQMVTFEKVGGEGSNITEFYPVDENGEKLSGEVNIQIYSDRGKLLESYAWFKGEDIDEGFEDGWYDDNQDETKSRKLDFGEGFNVYTTYTGSKLLYAGQVGLDAVAIPVPKYLSSKGNIRPTSVEMKDIVPVDENDDPVSGEINIQIYSDRGKLVESYAWFLGEDIDEGFEDGWYDDNQDEPKNKTFLAGEGFNIYTTYTGAFLKFPAIGSK